MKTILVVDDDSRMLKLIKGYLDSLYTVYPIKGGSTALRFLQDNKVDLILLDYLMPALDGPRTFELIRQIKGCEDTPVIFLTGVTEKSRVTECMAQDIAGYMVKPVAREELLTKIAEVIPD